MVCVRGEGDGYKQATRRDTEEERHGEIEKSPSAAESLSHFQCEQNRVKLKQPVVALQCSFILCVKLEERE